MLTSQFASVMTLNQQPAYGNVAASLAANLDNTTTQQQKHATTRTPQPCTVELTCILD